MPRALVTGIGGFVGPYLRAELEQAGYDVYGLERNPVDDPKVISADVTDREAVEQALTKVRPDAIIHLAGFSSVADSWEAKDLVVRINVGGTENLLIAANKVHPIPRVVIVSSAEAYGIPVSLPIDELHPLNAVSPYGRSRVAQEQRSLEIHPKTVIARSFNHTGPGQPPKFVIPSFVHQAVAVQAGLQTEILVGNLDAVRDFSDVRDVVRAYRFLLERGIGGQAYNVCSGRGYRVGDVLTHILNQLGLDQSVVTVDPKRAHPSDIPALIGSNKKINAATGWKPEFELLDKTIPNIVESLSQSSTATG